MLAAMHDGRIRCVAVDTTTPSAFAHELINAKPYAFLDDAGLEERRARAVQLRGVLPDAELGEAGRLSQDAIDEIRQEIWPDIRDEHELHDLLCSLVVVPVETLDHPGARDWGMFSHAPGAVRPRPDRQTPRNGVFCRSRTGSMA